MKNFTVGPVQAEQHILDIGKEQVPYFRTAEFSELMLENEKLMLEFCGATEGSKAVFMTGSGTASMETAVINLLTPSDKALIVNGGSFGQRFVELCTVYGVPFEEIKLGLGEKLTEEKLSQFNPQNYTAFIVNAHETSTGVLYDLKLISQFCKKNNLLFIVDAISSFLADELNMAELGVDAVIIGSQKALACPPGISILTLSPRAVELAYKNNPKCYYLNLKFALENQKRGQTPFTPAVSILIQINKRLKTIKENGGVSAEIAKVRNSANYFRNEIAKLPFEVISQAKSNAVTTLHPLNASAEDIFETLKNEYGIWVCPNGGEMKSKIFRVGHIGALSKEDYDALLDALKDMQNKNLL